VIVIGIAVVVVRLVAFFHALPQAGVPGGTGRLPIGRAETTWIWIYPAADEAEGAVIEVVRAEVVPS
jgi:hypothetical protein